MSRRKLYLVLLIIFVVVAPLWLWVHSERSEQPSIINKPKSSSTAPQQTATTPTVAPAKSSPAQIQAMQQQETAHEKQVWDLALATPISFYGKVVDDKDASVADAEVKVSFADSVWTGNTKRTVSTDANGLFHVNGHGLGIVVTVTKQGYYRIKESSGQFGYVRSAGAVDPHPEPNSPAIFVLRKMGQTESLIKFESDFRVSSTGAPVPVDLVTGRTANGNQSLVIEAWISPGPQNPNSNQPYDWHCRVSVPGGGIIEREGDFNFEAPETGYRLADEINAPASLGSKWRSQIAKRYFIKLASGNYARIEFTITAGGERFFTIQSYLNPKPGSRNLEADPNK